MTLSVAVELRRPLGHRRRPRARSRGAAWPASCRSDAIDEAAIRAATSQLGDVPDPDLFIRTGGEQRISNFLLWNLAYTELYFSDTLWPDFDDAELERRIRVTTAAGSGASGSPRRRSAVR